MNDLATIEKSVIELTDATPADRIAEVRMAVDFAKQECARLGKLLDERMMEIIRDTGPITIGPIRYYIGTPKETHARDGVNLFDTLMEAAQGDVEQIVKCFSANWPKPGTIRELFERIGRPEWFDRCFVVTEREELREGKPVKVKKLMKMDERFTPQTGGEPTPIAQE
jgi:hypothetical protein